MGKVPLFPIGQGAHHNKVMALLLVFLKKVAEGAPNLVGISRDGRIQGSVAKIEIVIQSVFVEKLMGQAAQSGDFPRGDRV